VELVSREDFPFELRLTLTRKGIKTFTCSERDVPTPTLAVHKYVRSLQALQRTGALELYDLERGSRLGYGKMNSREFSHLDQYRRVLDDVLLVEEHYQVEFMIPTRPTDEDLSALGLLRRLIDGEPHQIPELTLEVIKILAPSNETPEPMPGEFDYQVEMPNYFRPIILFGKEVATGPILLIINKAVVGNQEEYRRFLKSAAIGEAMKLVLRVNGIVTAVAQGTRKRNPPKANAR